MKKGDLTDLFTDTAAILNVVVQIAIMERSGGCIWGFFL